MIASNRDFISGRLRERLFLVLSLFDDKPTKVTASQRDVVRALFFGRGVVGIKRTPELHFRRKAVGIRAAICRRRLHIFPCV